MLQKTPKISIIGMGRVGSAIAFATLIKGLAGDLVLVDYNKNVALGEAFDLLHASAFTPRVNVRAGDYPDTADSDIVVITASIPMKNIKSRLDLVQGNYELFKGIIPEIARSSPGATLVVISNPVDICAYLAWKTSGFPASRVIGTGTLIDTGRFQALIADEAQLSAQDIHAYILGEHGDSEFAAVSRAYVGGVSFKTGSKRIGELFEEAKKGGYKVMEYKGYTSYAIALSATTLMECILQDGRRILPVSTLVNGYLGVSDVFLSLPAVVGREGVLKSIEIPLTPDEQEAFKKSAALMKDVLGSLK